MKAVHPIRHSVGHRFRPVARLPRVPSVGRLCWVSRHLHGFLSGGASIQLGWRARVQSSDPSGIQRVITSPGPLCKPFSRPNYQSRQKRPIRHSNELCNSGAGRRHPHHHWNGHPPSADTQREWRSWRTRSDSRQRRRRRRQVRCRGIQWDGSRCWLLTTGPHALEPAAETFHEGGP